MERWFTTKMLTARLQEIKCKKFWWRNLVSNVKMVAKHFNQPCKLHTCTLSTIALQASTTGLPIKWEGLGKVSIWRGRKEIMEISIPVVGCEALTLYWQFFGVKEWQLWLWSSHLTQSEAYVYCVLSIFKLSFYSNVPFSIKTT